MVGWIDGVGIAAHARVSGCVASQLIEGEDVGASVAWPLPLTPPCSLLRLGKLIGRGAEILLESIRCRACELRPMTNVRSCAFLIIDFY